MDANVSGGYFAFIFKVDVDILKGKLSPRSMQSGQEAEPDPGQQKPI
jgi:hypothetical protein